MKETPVPLPTLSTPTKQVGRIDAAVMGSLGRGSSSAHDELQASTPSTPTQIRDNGGQPSGTKFSLSSNTGQPASTSAAPAGAGMKTFEPILAAGTRVEETQKSILPENLFAPFSPIHEIPEVQMSDAFKEGKRGDPAAVLAGNDTPLGEHILLDNVSSTSIECTAPSTDSFGSGGLISHDYRARMVASLTDPPATIPLFRKPPRSATAAFLIGHPSWECALRPYLQLVSSRHHPPRQTRCDTDRRINIPRVIPINLLRHLYPSHDRVRLRLLNLSIRLSRNPIRKGSSTRRNGFVNTSQPEPMAVLRVKVDRRA